MQEEARTIADLVERCAKYRKRMDMLHRTKILGAGVGAFLVLGMLALVLVGYLPIPVLVLGIGAIILLLANLLYLKGLDEEISIASVAPASAALRAVTARIQSALDALPLDTGSYFFQSDKRGIHIHAALSGLQTALNDRISVIDEHLDEVDISWEKLDALFSKPLSISANLSGQVAGDAEESVTLIRAVSLAEELSRALSSWAKSKAGEREEGGD